MGKTKPKKFVRPTHCRFRNSIAHPTPASALGSRRKLNLWGGDTIEWGEIGEMSGSVDAAGEPIPTSAVLMAAAKHIATRCWAENVAFIKCKKKDPNPEKCLDH
ncbi:NADH dehydrogenase (ubiquinone) 1 alpha subcomplex [Musa troglodytarum]|uniref:NADH dehydrogenase (Ubiquinone) 1 alpha subcomplex n=1 Tax=Musa troglodytarum TaxID=320322 RepID=A0A9E7GI82_9LILI|nr:NADH dehydrogenase (ubiquinone) 1 alpha subcomplex [Musa troglodytarum]URE15914.1 NADH dehydrogenase (ubiquinone) 1 alpha subcomplex [Musa troglodytarum]